MDVLADTNIILRRLHRAHPQHRQARDALTTLSGAGNRVVVTSQNLVEVWAVCTRPPASNGFGLTPVQAGRVVARVESSVYRLPDTDEVYPEWRRLVVALGVSGKKTHDARIVAAMAVHGVTHILTFNADDFARYPGINVLHPAEL
ncbi:MAG: PIN domain-containing protein [Acidobacteria bacterium]|nr:PIN domain-containing protein [Acidobacteriota bacterium]